MADVKITNLPEQPFSSITNDEVLERVKIIKEQAQEVWLGQRQDI